MTKEELAYLKCIPYFKPDYLEYLRLLQLNMEYFKASIENNELQITIEGPWISTIWFEVPVLMIVSALFNEMRDDRSDMEFTIEQNGMKILNDKLDYLEDYPGHNFVFADFGTRRAWSPYWQDRVIGRIVQKKTRTKFIGTSNVYLAMKHGVKPIGTMSHQYLQAFQQLGPRVADSQKVALQTWANEYRGELGIALSDVVGFDAFLNDFDRYFALLFDGCRHDSGDPGEWGERLVAHYKKLRIDPMTKYAVFSDGLNFIKALDLNAHFNGKINTSFGIGTNLTNDVGYIPIQIVIKMVECNGRPVAKVSDSLGKGMCEDKEYLSYLKMVYGIKE
jgi:nicotinate phosphoribosyltransferase